MRIKGRIRTALSPGADKKKLIIVGSGAAGSAPADYLPVWELDASQQCYVTFDCVSGLRVLPPLYSPPAELELQYIKRRSEDYTVLTLSEGVPQNWLQNNATVVEDWARLRVIVNGEDMTFYRDNVTKVGGWTTTDPFGDATATIIFPQITSFDSIPLIIPKYSKVIIQAVFPDDSTSDLFHGMVIDWGDDGDGGTSFEVLGAFYEADLLLRKPTFQDELVDIANHINTTINGFIMLYNLDLKYMPEFTTGISRRARGFFEKTATGYVQYLLGLVQDVTNRRVTIECQNRAPELKWRDRTTVHWTVYNGGRGIKTDLRQDLLIPNVIYGEGVYEDNLLWRNTKYPNVWLDDPPVFDGNNITLGEVSASTLLWEQRMQVLGLLTEEPDGTYSSQDETDCETLQYYSGITVDGIVDAQTWAATFMPGSNSADISSAYIAPLAYLPFVEPALFNADGSIRDLNPLYDPDYPRIETYINFGQGINKAEASQAALRQIGDSWMNIPWVGTVTLESDPLEGSRFEIRAGQNIKINDYRGSDVTLHIVRADTDIENLSVTLDVDTQARDLMTYWAMKQRDAEAQQDPGARFRQYNRRSHEVEDRFPMWDYESGAGRVPLHAVSAGSWNVLRIPFGKYGEIVATDFTVSPACEFSIGVFDRPIWPILLETYGDPATTEDYWNYFDEHGLIISWGDLNQMAGYYPGRGSDGDTLTGRLVDKAAWVYSSTWAPWVWVAIWTDQNCNCQGRFYPGAQSGENLPTIY